MPEPPPVTRTTLFSSKPAIVHHLQVSACGPAAVDHQRMPGDERGRIGQQPAYTFGDLFRFSKTANRLAGDNLSFGETAFVDCPLHHWSVDDAGADAVHTDIFLCIFERGSLG